MGLKAYLGVTLAVFSVCEAYSACAQTAPAATALKAYSTLAIGAGLSGYNPDWGHGHMLGGTLWIDYTPKRVPLLLRGIGIEAEARDLNYGRSPSQPANLREDTAEGGVIYSWRRFRNFTPYGKFLMGFGNTDYGSTNGGRYHDSRTIAGFGGGVEFRAFRSIWARADYEYQTWPDFFKATTPAGLLNPQGVTVGVLYHFNRSHSH